ncbi:MAG: hypothetical protein EXQ71_10650 [Acidimicrobiia bacterium]|nr:hypothetical protein [Acidimicrobiia bacterium]
MNDVRSSDSDHRRPSRRLAALAAVVGVLTVGLVVVLTTSGDTGPSPLEVDARGNPLPALVPGTLTRVDPSRHARSASLPVEVTPTGLLGDAEIVTVSAAGFVPGEPVGVVQCVNESESPNPSSSQRACNVARVAVVEADADGVARSPYEVERFLTTPATGTIDCGAAKGRCLLGIGAINDNQRSGLAPTTFAGRGELKVPTLVLDPVRGTTNATVQVSGAHYPPNSVVGLQVCTTGTDPCWAAGLTGLAHATSGTASGGGVRADDDGRISVDIPAWRFLPGPQAGTYIDCAISRCVLVADPIPGSSSPPPATLLFSREGQPPVLPVIELYPATGVILGQTALLRGAGFPPDALVDFSISDAVTFRNVGIGVDDGLTRVNAGGTFALEFAIPDLVGLTCSEGGPACRISVSTYGPKDSFRPAPPFPPLPIPLIFSDL